MKNVNKAMSLCMSKGIKVYVVNKQVKKKPDDVLGLFIEVNNNGRIKRFKSKLDSQKEANEKAQNTYLFYAKMIEEAMAKAEGSSDISEGEETLQSLE